MKFHTRSQLELATPGTAWVIDASPHKIQFITVESGVTLEVLDWGGTGRPLLLLAGLGDSAHAFDNFAPKLTARYHVFGLTRRGIGDPSAPPPVTGAYAADRLGDDVLGVIDSLKLDRPIVAGWSIAGEELTSIGSRRPEKISGLIYLDAAYSYAYYDPEKGNLLIDANELQNSLDQLSAVSGPELPDRTVEPMILALLQKNLPRVEKDLQAWRDLKLSSSSPKWAASSAKRPMSRLMLLSSRALASAYSPGQIVTFQNAAQSFTVLGVPLTTDGRGAGGLRPRSHP